MYKMEYLFKNSSLITTWRLVQEIYL